MSSLREMARTKRRTFFRRFSPMTSYEYRSVIFDAHALPLADKLWRRIALPFITDWQVRIMNGDGLLPQPAIASTKTYGCSRSDIGLGPRSGHGAICAPATS